MFERMDMDKTQKEFMDSVRRMMSQIGAQQKDPQTEKAEKEYENQQKQKREKVLEFSFKPKDLKKYLDRFVVKQDDAKKVLSTAVCDHYNFVKAAEEGEEDKNYVKQNVLMLGPTGVGKTYLIKCLADLIGVPFVKADATKFSETGYVGGDVEDLVRDLVHKAEGDMDLARYGIVYIDEVDKIAAASNLSGRDVSGGGVQRGLLKIMEDTDVALRAGHDIQSQIQAMVEFQQKGKMSRPTINTRHILFIVSGAFGELASIIEKRLKSSTVGFSAKPLSALSASNLFREVSTGDFIQFGFEPEFIGRLPVRVVCDPLSEDDLYNVLAESEGSVLKQYRNSFSAYGISMDVRPDAMREIAKLAAAESTGARGLLTVCEKVFRDFKYELPSSRAKKFLVDARTVDQPDKTLQQILEKCASSGPDEDPEVIKMIEGFERAFQAKNGITILFDEEARAEIAEQAARGHVDAGEYLRNLFSDYPYGLGLIQKVKPKEKFVLTRDAVKNPNKVLDAWVKESYEQP